jgi:hypothetical protein
VDYDRASEEFWTQAYEGWSNGRWINAGSGWRLPEGRRGFDSDLARAFLSESKDRGSTRSTTAKPPFIGTLTNGTGTTGVSPYFGRLTTSIPSYRQELVNRFYQQPEAFPAAYADWYLAMDTLLWPVHNQGSKEIKEEWSRRLDGEPDFSWSIKEVVGYLLGQIETQALRGDLRTKDYWDEMVPIRGPEAHQSSAPGVDDGQQQGDSGIASSPSWPVPFKARGRTERHLAPMGSWLKLWSCRFTVSLRTTPWSRLYWWIPGNRFWRMGKWGRKSFTP